MIITILWIILQKWYNNDNNELNHDNVMIISYKQW